jgi:hypothetical protein
MGSLIGAASHVHARPRWYDQPVTIREDGASAQGIVEDDDEEFAYERSEAPPPLPQVPAYIAIIRIIAVLGMGLTLSFGLFIMLAGLRGVIIGVPILLLSIPCYLGMRLAERLVGADEAPAAGDEGPAT